VKRSVIIGLAALAVVGLLLTLTVRAPMGGRSDPLPAFKFAVEIDGIVQSNFREVSGISCSTEVIEYRDGNDPNVVRLLPGLTRCGPIILKGGLTDSQELWNWYKAVIDGNTMRKNGSIIVLDATGVEHARYNFHNGWPMKYTAGAFNAQGHDVAIEELDLAVERIDRA